ncbi:hypothetical protein CSKR_109982 [Clonorchis sinensis]|uniref:Uncharacterized protein n=1 Tax=Clonorchis sinensis TaxID=79923 RepID=A0A3R7CCC0_CLOSI|nr:hypothetical protein CSKR_109982 [Clonorchis sinensis]
MNQKDGQGKCGDSVNEQTTSALVLPSDGMTAKHRRGVTVKCLFISTAQPLDPQRFLRTFLLTQPSENKSALRLPRSRLRFLSVVNTSVPMRRFHSDSVLSFSSGNQFELDISP